MKTLLRLIPSNNSTMNTAVKPNKTSSFFPLQLWPVSVHYRSWSFMWTQCGHRDARLNDSSGHTHVLSVRISHKTSVSVPHAGCSCTDTALNLYGKNSRGRSRLVSHCLVFFWADWFIYLSSYLAIFLTLLQRKFEDFWWGVTAPGARLTDDAWANTCTHTHTQHFSTLFRCQNHNCLGKCNRLPQNNENSRERQIQCNNILV